MNSSPAWAGPKEGGLTQSLINSFLQDPNTAYWYLVLGRKESHEQSPKLSWGQLGHYAIEELLGGNEPSTAILKAVDRIENSGEGYSLEPHYEHSVYNMLCHYSPPPGNWQPEVDIQKEHTLPSGRVVTIRGKADGVDGHRLLEHKFKGRTDPSSFTEIIVDLQTNLYAYVLGCTEVAYDIIRIPDCQWNVPRQLLNESAKEYADRIWFDGQLRHPFPVTRHKSQWFMQETVPLTHIEYVIKYVFEPIAERICDWWELVTSDRFDPNNPSTWEGKHWHTPVRIFLPESTEYYKCPNWNFRCGLMDPEELSIVPSYYPEL